MASLKELFSKGKWAARVEEKEVQLQHEHLRNEVLDFFISHDEDPIDLLKEFAERLRKLINCDQVIYRDLENTRIMVNSPAIEKTWSVPIEYCQKCQHFDAHHPMYDGGYTEMSNCQKGWQGIPVYEKCPIKSSLTRIVYCDGKVAGYLAIHYVVNYHEFTDLERSTLEDFTRLLSLSLSRYEAKKRSSELEGIKNTMDKFLALSDEFNPIIVVDPENGKYDWFMSKAEEIERNTSMTVHGEDLYTNIGIDSAKVIHEDDRAQFKQFYTRKNLMRIAKTGDTQETENRWFVPEMNEYRWKYNKAVKMVDESGKAYVVIGVVDTTEAKARAEAEAAEQKRSQQNVEIISGLASEYVSLYYINLSDHTFRVYGIDTNRIADTGELLKTDKDCFRLLSKFANSPAVHPDDKYKFDGFDTRSVTKRLEHTKRFSIRFRRNYGQGYMWSEMDVVKVEGQHEKPNTIIIGFAERDREIRREMEQQKKLEEAVNMAEAANKAKTSFLFNMSHDIRTPMNAILGFTRMAINHIEEKDKVMDSLLKTQSASDLLLSLINSILDMSRIESGNAHLDENKGDVFYSFANIESTLLELAKTRDINLSFDFGEIRDRYVYCDFNRCVRIFVNIITNAIKYTPEGGTVKVLCEQVGKAKDGIGTYRYTISDNGIGMSEEFQKHVFEEFTREENTTISGIQGTGLGLAVCKSFVDLMNGTIECKSKQGEGTTFIVTLPFRLQIGREYADPNEVVLSTSPLPEEDGVIQKPKSFKDKKTLLVEDNELNREIASEILKEAGIIVETAEDGSKAVEIMKEKGPNYYNFILMDIQMPIMNGYEATKEIRKMYPDANIPIIAVSANAFAEDKAMSLAAGMNNHIAKPINIEEMFKELAKYL